MLAQWLEALIESEDDAERDFYDDIISSFDFRRYAELKQEFDESTVENSWFNLPFYISRGYKFAKKLDLHRRPPLQILDLACGPNYFGYVCQRLGHHVAGVDYPHPAFTAISDFLGVTFIGEPIKPQKPVPGTRRYDVVTAWRASFYQRAYGELWTLEDWSFFFDDLFRNRMTQQGQIHFMLNRMEGMKGLRVNSPDFAKFIEDLGGQAKGNLITFKTNPDTSATFASILRRFVSALDSLSRGSFLGFRSRVREPSR